MAPHPDQKAVAIAFRRECSTRRTLNVLDIKRQRIRDDLRQMLRHMALVVPSMCDSEGYYSPSEVLMDALDCLGDEAFTQFVLQLFDER